MDDLGNIVYVVIAIGWFFWNAYRKSQEKGANPQPAGSSGKRPKMESTTGQLDPFESLEKMMREQVSGKPEPQALKVKSERQNNADKFLHSDLTHSHLKNDYRMSVTEMQGHRVERQVKRAEMVEEETENLIDKILPNGFDLRQAVVLNAILERPYK